MELSFTASLDFLSLLLFFSINLHVSIFVVHIFFPLRSHDSQTLTNVLDSKGNPADVFVLVLQEVGRVKSPSL